MINISGRTPSPSRMSCWASAVFWLDWVITGRPVARCAMAVARSNFS